MPLLFFLAGVLTTLGTLAVILPWLRKMPHLASLPVLPRQASAVAVVLVALTLGFSAWFGHSAAPRRAAAPAAAGENSGSAFSDAAKVFASATGGSDSPTAAPGSPASPAATPAAGPMGNAIANLEARLAKGGGTEGDWELLAKSFEFLGRPADAAKARARQLPPVPSQTDASAEIPAPAPVASSAAAGTGAAVSGEVMLAPALKPKAAVGGTLFIVAKSVDAPGIPVAVFRGSVGNWPLKFTLDDSQSMMPGRNLSSAGRVTVEARISQKPRRSAAPETCACRRSSPRQGR